VEVTALPGTGAEVSGVDLTSVSDADLTDLKSAFARFGLLLFRDQQLSETRHIELAQQWGTINVNRFSAAHPDYPQIALVTKEPEQTGNIGGGWHTDHSYDEEPALGSILVAREVPETGGDTWFTSMYGAYDSLSPGLQGTLENLRAVHSAQHIFGTEAREHREGRSGRIGNPEAADVLQDVVHPVVIKHPLSGRKALYVNPAFTLHFEGWTREESLPLLQYLYEVAASEDLVTRFHWQPGSVAFWDNRSTWHFAQNDYHGMRREMHRITIEGCALSPAS